MDICMEEAVEMDTYMVEEVNCIPVEVVTCTCKLVVEEKDICMASLTVVVVNCNDKVEEIYICKLVVHRQVEEETYIYKLVLEEEIYICKEEEVSCTCKQVVVVMDICMEEAVEMDTYMVEEVNCIPVEVVTCICKLVVEEKDICMASLTVVVVNCNDKVEEVSVPVVVVNYNDKVEEVSAPAVVVEMNRCSCLLEMAK
ncbi:hypothetical protein KIW84_012516 [Lathyrus oleraceus]|uniref:Uncharacterized protein n=1 Tax=Pisum sativum TaxID=3888 RepID=A0A9D5GWG4_PEA|nr:hypothetical protein KIW84_012516 [Pisum sativum]